MKLDRNISGDGTGKYMLVKQRRVREIMGWPEGDEYRDRLTRALKTLRNQGVLDDSAEGDEGEFFVIRLRDKHARMALIGYAVAARADDPEYADDIMELAERAGPNSPFMKRPD